MKRCWMVLACVMLCASGCDYSRSRLPIKGVAVSAATVGASFIYYKTWSAQVAPEVQIKVESDYWPALEECTWAGCSSPALTFDDELLEANGRWVQFDCAAVARKIIDRRLISKTEGWCKVLHAEATAYWEAHPDGPSRLIDAEGHVWVRQNVK